MSGAEVYQKLGYLIASKKFLNIPSSFRTTDSAVIENIRAKSRDATFKELELYGKEYEETVVIKFSLDLSGAFYISTKEVQAELDKLQQESSPC
ncbi:hypothetical protein FSARC_4816 [Fusarium sarcochroum]|uniref:Uncharacterized protein n=1 Tax=Fusarium sarcochroum TaxID=1208366 RepID=A0A8H4XA71_9HYPO|nr:hypothetical protein FSARC_4816 [Fusarium sarcochroum]